MKIPYVTCDVFTTTTFGGNPLAVCYDARGLSDAQMQKIAAEFNYSETTFVLPPKDPTHTAEVRIFTPKAEIDFAGHPNVGTAIALADLGFIEAGQDIVFEEKAGLVPIDLERGDEGLLRATLTAPQPPQIGSEIDAVSLSRILSLKPVQIETTKHKPVMVSAGVYFLIVEVDGLASLTAAQSPDPDTSEAFSSEGIFLYCQVAQDEYRARMFAPNHGIKEDPATGSAVAAFAGLMGLLHDRDGEWRAQVVQGVEMGRPSYLATGFNRQSGTVSKIEVGGNAVLVRDGILTMRE